MALQNELCDETRFQKSVTGTLLELRRGVGDGLFTAYNHEKNWGIAHRVLAPIFRPLGVQGMFEDMRDVASQLVQKWARTEDKINVTDDYTRLTLDTIALCAMGKRLNSFYSENLHPFVLALVSFMVESSQRETETSFERWLHPSRDRRYRDNIMSMRETAKQVIGHRRSNCSEKNDLLNAMLLRADPKTGEHLDDETIINNIITFLAAGHETTSGLLAFTTYYLSKNPHTLRTAQAEVDSVVGKDPIQLRHMSQLPYLDAVLRETLRLQPTAPAFAVESNDLSGHTILGGKYTIKAGLPIYVLSTLTGRDEAVFGADAHEFDPDRMLSANFSQLPQNAWKPFGNGTRACIGRQFAWQESLLALALILQSFDVSLDDPTYQLAIKETITLKPENFFIRATLRKDVSPLALQNGLSSAISRPEQHLSVSASVSTTTAKRTLTILYGSNTGTCQALASSLARNSATHGFEATIMTMDEAVGKVTAGQICVIITPSYEGNPPDNGDSFVQWLLSESLSLPEFNYAVYGCGHSDWVSTYQKIPKTVDIMMETKGGSRIVARGESDVSTGTLEDDFDEWQDRNFWPALSQNSENGSMSARETHFKVNKSGRASQLKFDGHDSTVVVNKALTLAEPEKRHLELKLSLDSSYDVGDYVLILPVNNDEEVSRVLRRFCIPTDAVVVRDSGDYGIIPLGKEIAVSALLGQYAELQAAATRKDLSTISSFAPDKETADNIMMVGKTAGPKSRSIIDILEQYPNVSLPFDVFLSMLTSMRPRQYSISSSALHDPQTLSITFSVLGTKSNHRGVATRYMKTLQPGANVQIMLRKSRDTFKLPTNEKNPIIMICAGTGLAPFRGFVQERIEKIRNSQSSLGEALLFIGCRHPEQDMLYAEELQRAEKLGAVTIFHAFSCAPERSRGCRYVQDRLWLEREILQALYHDNAQAYICGSLDMANGVRDIAIKIAIKLAKSHGVTLTQDNAKGQWEALRGQRFVVDVFDC